MSGLPFLAVGIIFIVVGVFLLDENRYKKYIKFLNSLWGVKTQFNKTTSAYGKIGAIVCIVVGLVFVFLGFVTP